MPWQEARSACTLQSGFGEQLVPSHTHMSGLKSQSAMLARPKQSEVHDEPALSQAHCEVWHVVESWCPAHAWHPDVQVHPEVAVQAELSESKPQLSDTHIGVAESHMHPSSTEHVLESGNAAQSGKATHMAIVFHKQA